MLFVFFPITGVLEIGIRALLQHLACLGSRTIRLKTIFRVLLRETLRLASLLKSMVNNFIEENNETFYCVYAFKKSELCIVRKLIDY
jgi:hypothetical protein